MAECDFARFFPAPEPTPGHREGGWEVYACYTETKTCYVDYSGGLQSGGLQRTQIDNYDD